MENLSNMTKRMFKERSQIHIYGRGERRRVALYFGWKNEGSVIGYKYMIKGYGCTQAQILADAYDILIKDINDALCWYDTRTAKTDAERFKVSLMG